VLFIKRIPWLYKVKELFKCYKTPVFSYLLLLLASLIVELFFGWDISVYIMLILPALLVKDLEFFHFNTPKLLKGLSLSVIILFFYVLFLFLYSKSIGSSLDIREVGDTREIGIFLFSQFVLIAFPEEFFFRGYLQKEFGNTYKSIILVSVLFAIAHLILVCMTAGGVSAVCVNNAYTFFPSLVMGYLFMKTGTIWSSVAFHFMANVVYLVVYVV